MRVHCALLCLLLAPLHVAAAQIEFKAAPTAARQGDQVKVTFALEAPADIEVAILNAKGKVVRHLAAGVIGTGAKPPAPLRPGLNQTLTYRVSTSRTWIWVY